MEGDLLSSALLKEEEPWYDPAKLETYFAQFQEGEAPEDVDSDAYSLPELSELQEAAAAVDGEAARSDSKQGLAPGLLPIAARRSSRSPGTELAEKRGSGFSSVSSGETSFSRRNSPDPSRLTSPTAAVARRSGTPDEEGPKMLKSHASSSGGGSQLRRPLAGFSTVGKSVRCTDSPASNVDVRQKGYAKSRQKGPSEASIYEFVTMDVLRGKKKISKVIAGVQVPWANEPNKKYPNLPQALVVNVQLPNKGLSLFSKETDPGTGLVFYFKLRDTIIDDGAVRLAERFFAGAAPGRFKFLAFIDNVAELKFPTLLLPTLNKFNGKPIIIHKTGVFYNEPNISEVDIDVFQFPAAAKTVLSSSRTFSSKARVRVAFVLQGETEDELPERLLGCCEIKHLDLDSCSFDKFN